LASKSIEEAHNTQRAASGRRGNHGGQRSQASTTATANIATASITSADVTESMTINGRTWVLAPDISDHTGNIQPTVNLAEVSDDDVAQAMLQDNEFEFAAFLCENNASIVSIDWTKHSTQPDPSQVPAEPVAFTASRTPMTCLPASPFILDSSANCHVSPKRSDFKSLCPIPPISVKGFGGSSAQAVGMGSIELCVASGLKISLSNVLFIPSSTVCLMSVSALNRGGNYTCHFDSLACWVTNRSGTMILRGALSGKRNLYMINLPSAHVAHSPCSLIALYSERKPDIETWHRHLGHVNVWSIVDMARGGAVEGMTVDLSSLPPKCTHCVLGKQTRSPVPKVREGPKASRPLERVYVDLCGPMPCSSHSGRLYSMNVIDDFSSYIWSLPLRNKAEAAIVLQHWHKHVTTQFDRPLKILVTDNGELVSNSMST